MGGFHGYGFQAKGLSSARNGSQCILRCYYLTITQPFALLNELIKNSLSRKRYFSVSRAPKLTDVTTPLEYLDITLDNLVSQKLR